MLHKITGWRWLPRGMLLLWSLLAPPAFAHTGDIGGGVAAGFLHPISGLDHLLAMVAVGIWGAFLGRPLLWALPVAFPLMMVVGGVLGIAAVPLPSVESAIALSVIVLGVAIAVAWRAPAVIAVAVIAVFAVFHGHAHGTELPHAATPTVYAVGLVIANGLLHLDGIALGLFARNPFGATALRAGGGAIAATGVWILLGSPGVA
ncbi:MAG: HupE/UreJ family protein [Spongiibacteraceae bacterium]